MTNKILPEYTKRSCNTVAGTIDDSKTWNLDLRKLRNLGEGKLKSSNCTLLPMCSLWNSNWIFILLKMAKKEG